MLFSNYIFRQITVTKRLFSVGMKCLLYVEYQCNKVLPNEHILLSAGDRTMSNGLTFQQKSFWLPMRKKILLHLLQNHRTVELIRLKKLNIGAIYLEIPWNLFWEALNGSSYVLNMVNMHSTYLWLSEWVTWTHGFNENRIFLLVKQFLLTIKQYIFILKIQYLLL